MKYLAGLIDMQGLYSLENDHELKFDWPAVTLSELSQPFLNLIENDLLRLLQNHLKQMATLPLQVFIRKATTFAHMGK